MKEEKNELPIEEKEIIDYYKNKFSIIESNINKDKQKEYEERKRTIIDKLSMTPQRLPVTQSITINSEIYSYIQTEWIQQEQNIREHNPDFNLNISYLSIKPNDIIKKTFISSFSRYHPRYNVISIKDKKNYIFFFKQLLV